MHLVHFVINISQKCMSSADVCKYRDSVLGHEDCLAANSKSMGPPQRSADDRNCSIDSAVRPTSAEWHENMQKGWNLLGDLTTAMQINVFSASACVQRIATELLSESITE